MVCIYKLLALYCCSDILYSVFLKGNNTTWHVVLFKAVYFIIFFAEMIGNFVPINQLILPLIYLGQNSSTFQSVLPNLGFFLKEISTNELNAIDTLDKSLLFLISHLGGGGGCSYMSIACLFFLIDISNVVLIG